MRLIGSSRGSPRGVWLVVGIFLLGGAVLEGLFLAPHPASPPPAPAAIEWGVPARQLRFVSYNVLHNQRGLERVVEQIKKLQPDFVFLQEVESDHVREMAKQLGMERTYQ